MAAKEWLRNLSIFIAMLLFLHKSVDFYMDILVDYGLEH